jgi:hypothetical protein
VAAASAVDAAVVAVSDSRIVRRNTTGVTVLVEGPARFDLSE